MLKYLFAMIAVFGLTEVASAQYSPYPTYSYYNGFIVPTANPYAPTYWYGAYQYNNPYPYRPPIYGYGGSYLNWSVGGYGYGGYRSGYYNGVRR